MTTTTDSNAQNSTGNGNGSGSGSDSNSFVNNKGGGATSVSSYNNNINNNKAERSKADSKAERRAAVKLTEAIVDFNENSLDPAVNDTFQMKLMQLMLVIIMLEEQIGASGKNDAQLSSTTASDASSRVHLTVGIVGALFVFSFKIIIQGIQQGLKVRIMI